MPKKQAKACVQPTQMVKTDGKDVVMDENLVLFHKGWPSQWHMSDFEDEEGKRFNCCEQYMMFHKARLMGDMDTAQDVMKTANPAQQKRLGRLVANFDADLWDKVRSPLSSLCLTFQSPFASRFNFRSSNRSALQLPVRIIFLFESSRSGLRVSVM